jgi:multidrug efflux pump subunit AcrB
MLEMSALVAQNPAVEDVAVSQGSAPARYCLVRPMTAGGDCYGELMVDCKDYATVVKEIPGIRSMLRQKYPDAYIRIRKYNFSISTTHTVEVEFAGPDPEVLRSLSAQAEAIMRQSKYVDPYSVQNNWKPKGKALVAEYSRPDAIRAGVERSDIGNALQAATDGMTVGVMNDQDRMVMVKLQVRNADGSRIQNVSDIPVWSLKSLRATPLSNVTNAVTLGWDEDMVLRNNGQRVIEAECDPNPDLDEATPAKVVADIQQAVEAIPLPEGYQMRWVGEGEIQGEAIGNLMKYVPITMFIILAILLFLFNSWRKVGLILLFPLRVLRHHAGPPGERTTHDLHGHHRPAGPHRHDDQERHRIGGRDQPPATRREGSALHRRRGGYRVARPPRIDGIAHHHRGHAAAGHRPDVRLHGHPHHGRTDDGHGHHTGVAAHFLLSPLRHPQAGDGVVTIYNKV